MSALTYPTFPKALHLLIQLALMKKSWPNGWELKKSPIGFNKRVDGHTSFIYSLFWNPLISVPSGRFQRAWLEPPAGSQVSRFSRRRRRSPLQSTSVFSLVKSYSLNNQFFPCKVNAGGTSHDFNPRRCI